MQAENLVYDTVDPEDIADNENNEDFASFQRAVYQVVLGHIFRDLANMASEGEAVKGSDGLVHIWHPYIHIGSMDAEEAARYLGVRSASANVPCLTGYIAKEDLHDLTAKCEPRTVEGTQRVLQQAASARTKKEAEEILRNHGLHSSKVCHSLLLPLKFDVNDGNNGHSTLLVL